MNRLLAATLAAAAVLAVAPAAHADNSRAWNDSCLTNAEIRATAHGMQRTQGAEILGGPGVRDEQNTTAHTIGRQYAYCGKPFDRTRVYVFYNRSTDRMGEAMVVTAIKGTHLV